MKNSILILAVAHGRTAAETHTIILERFERDISIDSVRMAISRHVQDKNLVNEDSVYYLTKKGAEIRNKRKLDILAIIQSPHEHLVTRIKHGAIRTAFAFNPKSYG